MKTVLEKPNSRKSQMEKRRLVLLDTAISKFAEGGFAKTTVKDIAASAGISSGLLYHYFPSKEKLLEAAVEKRSFLPQMRRILTNTKKPCSEVLINTAVRFSALLEQEKNSIRILLQEGHSNTEVKKVWDSLSRRGGDTQFLASRIAAGELKRIYRGYRPSFSIIFMSIFKGYI